VLDARRCGNRLEYPPLAVFDIGLAGLDKLEGFSGRVKGIEKADAQFIRAEPSSPDSDNNLRRIIEQGDNARPRLAQKLPVGFNAAVPVILSLSRDWLRIEACLPVPDPMAALTLPRTGVWRLAPAERLILTQPPGSQPS
jgi:hypothetical protein